MFSFVRKLRAAMSRRKAGGVDAQAPAAAPPPQEAAEARPEPEVASAVAGNGPARAQSTAAAGVAEEGAALGALLSGLLRALEDCRPRPEPPKRPTMSERFSSARTVVISTLTIAVLFLIIAAVVYEVREDSVQIAAFEVPEELAKKGYTSNSMTNALAKHFGRINREGSQLLEMRGPRFTTGAQENSLDIEVPQANVSLKPIIRYVKGLIRPATRIEGEVIVNDKSPNKSREVTLNLRVLNGKSGETGFVSRTGPEQNLSSMMEDGAEELYAYVEPVKLATFVYNQNRANEGNKNRAADLIRYALQNNPTEDDYWAYVVLGIIRLDEHEYAEAQLLARKAISLSPKLGEAYHLLGNIYDDMSSGERKYGPGGTQYLVEQATANYEKALSLNPKFSGTSNNLGLIFLNSGDYRQARSYFEKSLAVSDTWDEPHTNLGRALQAQSERERDAVGLREKAAAEFQTATILNPGSAYAFRSWGDFLRSNKDYEGALDKYLSALRLGDGESQARYDSSIKELIDESKAPVAADAYIKWGDLLRERMRTQAEEGAQAASQRNYADASARYASAEATYAEASAKYDAAKGLKADAETEKRAADARTELDREWKKFKRPKRKAKRRK